MSERIIDPISAAATEEHAQAMSGLKEQLRANFVENKPITDGAYDESLAATCVNGTFVGKDNDGVVVYRGIPFVGRQPTGELRWKPPVDVEPDNGVYEAYYNAKTAPQREIETSAFYVQGEDCLYLNIWKAAEASSEKRPVMVWVHGGGYEIGGTFEPGYDFSNFVRENPGVILVSICYRLGVLGFLHLSHLPDGADYADAQNLGLLDQMAALKWVHENIAAFGGDPDRVTFFGESAGAGSVTLLPLIEGSHRYLRRVIAESGSPAFSISTEQAIKVADELMEELHCETVADLLKIDAQELVRVAGEVFRLRAMPERDGRILPRDTLGAYAEGAAKDIDLIIGCNKDEMNCWVSSMGVDGYLVWGNDLKEKKLAQLTDDQKALVEGFCADVKGEDFEHVSRLLDQIWFIAPFIRTAENQATAGGRVYAYLFTVESSEPLMKSGHGVELQSVLNHPNMVVGRLFDETFSKTMRRMWVQFATCGDPSLSADASPDGKAKEWPTYDLKDRQVMVFDEFDIHPESEPERGIVDRDRTYFLTKHYLY